MVKEMRLLGFTFVKMNVEKNPDFKGKVEVNSKMDVADIEKHKQTLLKQDTAKIKEELKWAEGLRDKYKLEYDVNMIGINETIKKCKEKLKGGMNE